MTLTLWNTLTGRKEPFEPIEAGRVRMYHCGPTVKEPATIGKFRAYLLADLLRRAFERRGQEVFQVMNITDVGHLNAFQEDVIEVAAGRTGLSAVELTAMEEAHFHEDRRALHIRDAHQYPRAREHVDDMIAIVQGLEAKGLTYKAAGNIYLDVEKARRDPSAPALGRLRGRPEADLPPEEAAGPGKRRPFDIDLWRTDALHQMHWQSPWGLGFPGWHVECVAMSRRYLGGAFDIHTGTIENAFPHHECEIAQAEALGERPLARYWLHTGTVLVDGKPMTRTNQNVLTARKLLGAGFRGAVLRVALLRAPYREPLDFCEDAVKEARARVNAVLGFHEHLVATLGDAAPARARGPAPSRAPAGAERPAAAEPAWIAAAERRIDEALADDLAYGRALDAVVEAIESVDEASLGDPRVALAALVRWDQALGIIG